MSSGKSYSLVGMQDTDKAIRHARFLVLARFVLVAFYEYSAHKATMSVRFREGGGLE